MPQRRRSNFIGRKPASNIHHSVALAEALGQPLTHFITINFEKAGFRPEAVHGAFQKLRDTFFGQWCRRPGRSSGFTPIRPTFAWVREATGASGAHWLLHCPPGRELELMQRLPQWLKALSGTEPEPGAIDVRKAYRARGARKYMLKGIDPAYARFYGIQHQAQGEVDGKRCGVSQNLGPSAKRRMRAEGRYPRSAGFYRPKGEAVGQSAQGG